MSSDYNGSTSLHGRMPTSRDQCTGRDPWLIRSEMAASKHAWHYVHQTPDALSRVCRSFSICLLYWPSERYLPHINFHKIQHCCPAPLQQAVGMFAHSTGQLGKSLWKSWPLRMLMAPAWHSWVNNQVEQLQAQDLLRSLKPLIPGHSAVEVRFTLTPARKLHWCSISEPGRWWRNRSGAGGPRCSACLDRGVRSSELCWAPHRRLQPQTVQQQWLHGLLSPPSSPQGCCRCSAAAWHGWLSYSPLTYLAHA